MQRKLGDAPDLVVQGIEIAWTVGSLISGLFENKIRLIKHPYDDTTTVEASLIEENTNVQISLNSSDPTVMALVFMASSQTSNSQNKNTFGYGNSNDPVPLNSQSFLLMSDQTTFVIPNLSDFMGGLFTVTLSDSTQSSIAPVCSVNIKNVYLNTSIIIVSGYNSNNNGPISPTILVVNSDQSFTVNSYIYDFDYNVIVYGQTSNPDQNFAVELPVPAGTSTVTVPFATPSPILTFSQIRAVVMGPIQLIVGIGN